MLSNIQSGSIPILSCHLFSNKDEKYFFPSAEENGAFHRHCNHSRSNGLFHDAIHQPVNLFSTETARRCVDKVNIKGRFSILYKLDDREESLHGKFGWEQSPENTVVTLMSPLGQTIAKIEITPQMTTFTAPNRAPASAPDAEELIKSQLGWTLPVSGMKGWLQGCATDSRGQSFIATPESTQVFTRDGWQINYASWIDGPTMPLPKRIDLIKGNQDSLNGVDINLKLVIDEWNF